MTLRARSLVLATVVVALAGACSSGSKSARSPSTSRATSRASAADAPSTSTTAPFNGDVYAFTKAGMLSPAVAGITTRVYVPNSESNTLDIIDPTTYTVIAHYGVGALPQHVTPSWDLRTLYVDNDKGNSLTPIDPRTGALGTPIPVDDPYNLYFTPDGTKAIVVAERLQRLDFRDPHTWKLIKSVHIPHTGADHLDFTVDGNELVVSCEFSGWLVRVDVRTMSITGELRVGGQPIDVKLSPDGQSMYVANQSRNGVSVIDPARMIETAFIPTGGGAHGLYPSRDGKLLYVSNRTVGSISVIEFATNHVVATWNIGGTPDMGGVSADGRQLWLSGRYSGSVYVIDTTTGRLLHTIPVGAGPHGLDIFPQPGRYSIGHTGNYR
ncbi:MAG: YncE family protein [Actinobacteria bacterium]|nr:YncE family protein [Actinomycetota bacterium]